MANLTSFIENYLKNKKISDYESYVAAYGADPEKAYSEAKKEAAGDFEKAKATYGKTAASLLSRGLSGSGYSDYLNASAYAEYVKAKEAALIKKEEITENNRKGYLSYLAEQEKAALAANQQAQEKSEKEQKLFDELLEQNLLDEGAAATYLTARGMDEEKAKAYAKESIQVLRGKKSLYTQIITEAKRYKMDYSQTIKYALLQGASTQLAEEIAQIVAFQNAAYQNMQ